MISIWFRYDFDMILICQRLWFSYGFGVPPFFWYDFVMVLGRCMLSGLGHFAPSWVVSSLQGDMWTNPRPHLPCTPVAGPRPHLPPPTPSTPVAGPRPHLPPPSPDPGHTSHPVAGQWNHWGTLRFQTLVSFWFFLISRHVAACYRPTESSLNLSFSILGVKLARRRGFQCCCKLSLGFSHSFHIPFTSSCRRVFALLQASSHRYSHAQAIPTYRQSFSYSYYSVVSLFQNFCPGVCVPCTHYYNNCYYWWWLDFIRTVLMMSWTDISYDSYDRLTALTKWLSELELWLWLWRWLWRQFDWTLRMDPYTVYNDLHCFWAYWAIGKTVSCDLPKDISVRQG